MIRTLLIARRADVTARALRCFPRHVSIEERLESESLPRCATRPDAGALPRRVATQDDDVAAFTRADGAILRALCYAMPIRRFFCAATIFILPRLMPALYAIMPPCC